MTELSTEDDDYYGEDFEDDDEGSSSSRTTSVHSNGAKAPVQLKGGVTGAAASPHSSHHADTATAESSFSSYHTSDEESGDDEAARVQAVLGIKRSSAAGRSGKATGEDELHLDQGEKLYPTEASASRKRQTLTAIEHADETDYPTSDGNRGISNLHELSTPATSPADRNSEKHAPGQQNNKRSDHHAEEGGVARRNSPLSSSSPSSSTSATAFPPRQKLPSITVRDVSGSRQRTPVSLRTQQRGSDGADEGNGVVHLSNITSVEMLASEGDPSRFRGKSHHPVDEDDVSREIHTASVSDCLPLTGRIRPLKRPTGNNSNGRDDGSHSAESGEAQGASASEQKASVPATPQNESAGKVQATRPSSSSSSSSGASSSSAASSSGQQSPSHSSARSAEALQKDKKLSTITPSQSKRHSDEEKPRGESFDSGTGGIRRRVVTALPGPSPTRTTNFTGEYDPYKKGKNGSHSTASSAVSSPAASDRVKRPPKTEAPNTSDLRGSTKAPIMKSPMPQGTPLEPLLGSRKGLSPAPVDNSTGPWQNGERDASSRFQSRRASNYSCESLPAANRARGSSSATVAPNGAEQPGSLRKTSDSAPHLLPKLLSKATNTNGDGAGASASGGSGQHRKQGSSVESADTSAADKAALAAYIESLKHEVTEWSQKIDAKEVQTARLRRRYYGEDEDDEGVDETGLKKNAQRRGSNDAGGVTDGKRKKGLPRTKKQYRLDQLRKQNKELEAKRVRYEGEVVNVAFLVARLDEQLIRFQNRLKELQALRRAMDNRDKRAAHTIEEVHRRMPSKEQLRDRQLNEGIYHQTSLDRRVRDVRQQIAKAIQSREYLNGKCEALEKEVTKKKLASINSKDYAQLKETSEANAKQIQRLKTAVTVYMNAVNTILGTQTGTPASGRRDSPSLCTADSNVTTPRTTPRRGTKSLQRHSRTHSVALEDGDESNVSVQRETAAETRTLLEMQIADLEAKIAQRISQIEANEEFVERNKAALADPSPPSVPLKAGPSREHNEPLKEAAGKKKTDGSARAMSEMLFGNDSGGGGKAKAKIAANTDATAAASGARKSKNDPLPPKGTSKRVIAGSDFSGTATLERVESDNEKGGAGDYGRDNAASSVLDDNDEEEDSVDELLRAISEESERLGGGLFSGNKIPATADVETPTNDKPSGAGAADGGNATAAAAAATEPEEEDEDLNEAIAESVEDNEVEAFNFAKPAPVVADADAAVTGAGAGGDCIDEDDSIAAAGEAVDSGRSTPVWLR